MHYLCLRYYAEQAVGYEQYVIEHREERTTYNNIQFIILWKQKSVEVPYVDRSTH